MTLSRRHCISAGIGAGAATLVSSRASAQLMNLYSSTASAGAGGYLSTLISGYTPKYSKWQGMTWSADMGSTWVRNMDYAWRATQERCRFELHNTVNDRPSGDGSKKRRSELHLSRVKLPNNTQLWGAFSFKDQPWSDRAGMARTTGGTLMQMHAPGSGSPAFAIRRGGNGNLVITTVGELDPNNHKRYDSPLAFNTVHDVVYRCVLHPTAGQLDVWIDRRRVISLRNQSIGYAQSGHYACFGLYFSGGVTCPVVCEFGNWVTPSTASLSGRTTRSPAWPTR
ncbi:hypothetical protein ACUXST_001043 [Sphingomonas sp. F9_3S_D5_B_2]